MREKTFLHFMELGKYLERLDADCQVYICGDTFFLSAKVYELRCTFRFLMRLEVGFCDYFPYTLYL